MNNQISTAILSYGMSGEIFHAPLLHVHPGFRLHTILQRSSQKAKERYPDVKIVRSLEEVYNDSDIDLVVINTPNETHFDFTKRALEAGKHVIVEKPFTVTTQEADSLIDISKKHGKILSVFQNRRWDGGFLTVKKILDGKTLGKIAEFEAHYDRYRNYIQAETWKEEEGRGTGILYNLGSHMLDQVFMLFGLPKSVDARVGIQREGGKVDDFYDVRMQYDGFLVILKSSYLVCDPGPQYIIHGTLGSFTKYGIDPQEEALKEGKWPDSEGWGTETKEWWGRLKTADGNKTETQIIETLPGNYLGFYQNIYEVIREGKDLIVKPEQARDVIRVIEACYESNKTKCSIAIN
jgi:predicted dehydrogenase